MIVLIDNGHGSDTPGKCSPDRKLREYLKSREIARKLEAALNFKFIDARLLVEEDKDISLPERCRRANAYCDMFGKENVLLVSIHCNAAGGDGKWKSAGGWCVYTSPGKTKADDLATAIWNAADERLKDYKERFPILQAQGAYDSKQKPMRADWSDGDPDYEARFYILVHTKCPAVLTESLFQDNKADCDFLLSDEGTQAIVDLHANGIYNYIKSLTKS
ncbi:MAG: N-acetylmuramoyl-L-alanine amidase [Paraprevotella sp.]|nr:N-acetylmuramoyl-L-alanine amidase [Paraprevotella sp.]